MHGIDVCGDFNPPALFVYALRRGLLINTFRPYRPYRERELPERAFQGGW